MATAPHTVRYLSLGAAILVAGSGAASAASTAVPDGAIHRFDLGNFKRLTSLDGSAPGGEFGTVVSDGFLVTAPAAADGGVLAFVSGTTVDDATTAADLLDAPAERLGESWGDLGHPPGTSNALVIGAPSLPSDTARAATPAAIIVEYAVPNRFVREVRRVTGIAGSLFGWRVSATDSRAPEASYNGAFFVSAPLEAKGKQAPAGAVYKFDTDTGRQLWRFRGERPGEYAGYAIQTIIDQDGDGVTDLFVGAPGHSSLAPAGRVYLLSGRTGKVIRRLESPPGAVHFGYALGTGSVTGLGILLVGAPGTEKGKKTGVGAVYAYPDLDSAPTVFSGKKRDQRFGIAFAVDQERLFVGAREGHKKVKKDARGSVTVLTTTGKKVKFLRGKRGGEHFGRTLSVALNRALVVGAPGAPPLFGPE